MCGMKRSEAVRIDSSGRLLINTTSNSNGHISSSNLAVQGADLAIFKDSGGDKKAEDKKPTEKKPAEKK